MSCAEEQIGDIAAEFRYSCWVQRHPPSCALLADFLAVIQQSKKRSSFISRHACDSMAFGPSCYQSSIDYIFDNKHVSVLFPMVRDADANWKKAFEYFSRGCKVGHARSCYRKGQMMIQPKGTYKGVKSNPVEGLASLESACDGGCFEACYEASVHLLSGKLPQVPADHRRAFIFTKTACEFGFLNNACHNLAAMYEHGIATKKDPQVAKKVRAMMTSPRPPPPS